MPASPPTVIPDATFLHILDVDRKVSDPGPRGGQRKIGGMDPGSQGSPPENLRFSGSPTVRDDEMLKRQ
jgi:hypothetical protein